MERTGIIWCVPTLLHAVIATDADRKEERDDYIDVDSANDMWLGSDHALISRLMHAWELPNTTDYDLAELEDVRNFLRKHVGCHPARFMGSQHYFRENPR